jgi:PAS domain S-box-containing protein
MPDQKPLSQEPLSEVEALRAKLAEVEGKLAEAQEVIRAIQAGDVDALVVSGPEGDQVFTLSGAERTYRDLVEAMHEGAATLSSDGLVLYCNQRLADLLQIPLEQMIGSSAARWFTAEFKPIFENLFAQALRGQSATAEVELSAEANARPVPAYVSLREMKAEEPKTLCLVVSDISERRRVAEAIKAERQRFLDVLETLPAIVTLLRPDHRVVWANRAYRQALGDNAGRLCFESQFGCDQPCPECQAFTPLQTGQPHNWEWELPNGRTFEIYNSPLADIDGSPLILEMDIDVTERRRAEAELEKHRQHLEELVRERTAQLVSLNAALQADIAEKRRAEQALRENEEQFRVLAENLVSAVALINEHGQFNIVNKSFLRMFDLDEHAGILNVNSRDWSQWRVFDENGRLMNLDEHPVRQVVLTRTPIKDKLVAVQSPARTELKWLLVSAEPILDGHGNVQRVICTYHDITARKQAEEALRASEERLRLLGDNLPNSMVYQYTHDPDGTPRFLYVSAGVEWLSGVKPEEVLKDAGVLHRQFLPEDLAALLEAEKVSARDLSVFERDVQMRLPDGQLRWMRLRSRPRRLPDGRVIWDGVQTDITDHKGAEEALLRSEKLASVGRMAATISHEINNPLAAVTNSLYLAKSVANLPELARHYLETADEELRRVTHLTRQALGFYREATVPAPTSVPEVLESALGLLKSRINTRHAVIEKQCDGDVQITAVAGELRQVFSNLLANSLDAIDESGIVKVRVSTGAACNGGNPWVRITVADNGQGIGPAFRSQVFEPFFTTKGTIGTGLGLWVSKQLIEKHGGAIRLRSRTSGPRRGTTVSILLSANPEARSLSAGG